MTFLIETGIGEVARTDLIEKYDCEKPPSGGEFYFHVRLYEGAFDRYFETTKKNRDLRRLWLARWESLPQHNGRKNSSLTRLLDHREYVAAFDKFFPLKVLHSGLLLGSVGRMLSLGCEDVSLRPQKMLLGNTHLPRARSCFTCSTKSGRFGTTFSKETNRLCRHCALQLWTL